jgi:hypothetical protein
MIGFLSLTGFESEEHAQEKTKQSQRQDETQKTGAASLTTRSLHGVAGAMVETLKFQRVAER